MRNKLIDNEFYVAVRIDLSDYEKKLLNCFLTFKELTMAEVCVALRMNIFFSEQVIKNINKKIGHFYKIEQNYKRNKYCEYEVVYKLVPKER